VKLLVKLKKSGIAANPNVNPKIDRYDRNTWVALAGRRALHGTRYFLFRLKGAKT